jgi:glycosyltransferase involved in cell wall biosynthesis
LDGGRFGRLVPVGDVTGLAEAIAKELEAADVGPDARRAERATWLDQYEPEAVTARYLRLIRDVIGESRT